VAAEAGFTKGAVYSNFASKEDLFFAVYERRVDARVAEVERILEAASTPREGIVRIIPGNGDRPEADDGWMAVFFEFWAHVLRHPELRERFAAQHRRRPRRWSRAARICRTTRTSWPPPATPCSSGSSWSASPSRTLWTPDSACAWAGSSRTKEGSMGYRIKRLQDMARGIRQSKELVERERWPRERLERFQQARLEDLIRYAAAARRVSRRSSSTTAPPGRASRRCSCAAASGRTRDRSSHASSSR
jgi:hypothetical protein